MLTAGDRTPGCGTTVRAVRVIAGTARGRRLEAPRGSRTRPTTDRVRESVFGALGSRLSLEGASVLDLFAGSGAMGIEALSRGAASVTFVDDDAAAVAAVRANLLATGLGGGAEVVRQRVESWLATDAGARYVDVAFCDPPYAYDGWQGLLDGLRAGLVVIESDRPIAAEGWGVARQRRYGTTFVTFAEPTLARPDHLPPDEAEE